MLTCIAFNIFTDVLFATFPVPIIWTLQMKLRTRLYLIGILSLGYMCVFHLLSLRLGRHSADSRRNRAVVMGILKAIFQIAFATDTDKSL